MDAFFAAVEQLDNPKLKGKPVIVGGHPDSRGVVATASYEARAFGIRSAMSAQKAFRLCPKGIFVKPRMERYKEISGEVFAIFGQYTKVIEPVSIDEAYLDVTDNELRQPSATLLAKQILEEIRLKTSLSASAGVASSKLVAKIASDMQKPGGLVTIAPHQVMDAIAPLAASVIPGIGRVTAGKMQAMGIHKISDLRNIPEEELVREFGQSGRWYFRASRGDDLREVVTSRDRKSLACEHTFGTDLVELAQILTELSSLSSRLYERLEKIDRKASSLTLKITFNDFQKISRSQSLRFTHPTSEQIFEVAQLLLTRTQATKRPLRLLGLSLDLARERQDNRPIQLVLPGFDTIGD